MIGLRKDVKLEGRAAIELEASIPPATTGRYRSDLHEATRCESICVLKEPAICISGQILNGIKTARLSGVRDVFRSGSGAR